MNNVIRSANATIHYFFYFLMSSVAFAIALVVLFVLGAAGLVTGRLH